MAAIAVALAVSLGVYFGNRSDGQNTGELFDRSVLNTDDGEPEHPMKEDVPRFIHYESVYSDTDPIQDVSIKTGWAVVDGNRAVKLTIPDGVAKDTFESFEVEAASTMGINDRGSVYTMRQNDVGTLVDGVLLPIVSKHSGLAENGDVFYVTGEGSIVFSQNYNEVEHPDSYKVPKPIKNLKTEHMSVSGAWIASLTSPNTVRIFHVSSPTIVRESATLVVKSAMFHKMSPLVSDDGLRAVVACESGSVFVFSRENAQSEMQLSGVTSKIGNGIEDMCGSPQLGCVAILIKSSTRTGSHHMIAYAWDSSNNTLAGIPQPVEVYREAGVRILDVVYRSKQREFMIATREDATVGDNKRGRLTTYKWEMVA